MGSHLLTVQHRNRGATRSIFINLLHLQLSYHVAFQPPIESPGGTATTGQAAIRRSLELLVGLFPSSARDGDHQHPSRAQLLPIQWVKDTRQDRVDLRHRSARRGSISLRTPRHPVPGTCPTTATHRPGRDILSRLLLHRAHEHHPARHPAVRRPRKRSPLRPVVGGSRHRNDRLFRHPLRPVETPIARNIESLPGNTPLLHRCIDICCHGRCAM